MTDPTDTGSNLPRFMRPEPYTPSAADLEGFSVGVLRVIWRQPAQSFTITGREGRVFVGDVVECRTRTGRLPTELGRAMLFGVIIRAPDGALSRITGLETFLMMEIGAGGPAGELGILLVSVEEP